MPQCGRRAAQLTDLDMPAIQEAAGIRQQDQACPEEWTSASGDASSSQHDHE